MLFSSRFSTGDEKDGFMKGILNIAVKELVHLRRDRRAFPILFMAPLIQIILLGLAATMEVKETPFLIIKGEGRIDPFWVERKVQGDYFRFKGVVYSMNEAIELIRAGKVEVAICTDEPIGILVDGTNSNNARIISSYLFRILAEFPGREKKLKPSVSMHVLYNEKLSSRNFMVPGVLATILLVITLALTSLSFVREKEWGTIEQVITTPIKKYHFVVGKLIPYLLIGIVDAGVITLAGVFILGVPFRGSALSLFFFCLLFVMSTSGLGIFFSVISRTQQQAMMTIFMVMLPLIILSGFIFPVENMPRFFQILSQIDPFTHFLKAVRFIFLRGSGMSALYRECLALFATGTALLTFSVFFFRKSL